MPAFSCSQRSGPTLVDKSQLSRPYSNLLFSAHLFTQVRVQLCERRAGGWGLGEQPGTEKGACGQGAGMFLTSPEMSMLEETTSFKGNQEELPAGGPGMEDSKEETEFSPQEGALTQLGVGVCSQQSKGFQGDHSGN